MAFGSGTRQWMRGTKANIAAATAILGSGEVLVDDSGSLYGGDGVTQIKNLKRLLRRDELVLNVKDYGATGNGIADDTAAINAVITAAPSGATLLFPPGAYRVTAQITVNKPLSFRLGTARILADTAGLNGYVVITAAGSGTRFEGGTFDSNNKARSAIIGSTADDVRVAGCTFTGYSDATTYSSGDAAVKVGVGKRWKISGNTFRNWGNGMQLQRCVALNDAGVSDCIVTDNLFDTVCIGISVVGQRHVIANNVFRSTSDNGVYITTSAVAGIINRDIQVTGNTFANCEEAVVIAGSNETTTEWTENITIANNTIKDWTVRGISFEGRIRGLAITGNTFSTDIAAPGTYVGIRSAQSATQLTENFTLTGNTMRGKIGYTAVWLQGLTAATIASNVFSLEPTAATQRMIRVQYNAAGVAVTGNTFRAIGTNAATCAPLESAAGTVTASYWLGNPLIGCAAFNAAGFTTTTS